MPTRYHAAALFGTMLAIPLTIVAGCEGRENVEVRTEPIEVREPRPNRNGQETAEVEVRRQRRQAEPVHSTTVTRLMVELPPRGLEAGSYSASCPVAGDARGSGSPPPSSGSGWRSRAFRAGTGPEGGRRVPPFDSRQGGPAPCSDSLHGLRSPPRRGIPGKPGYSFPFRRFALEGVERPRPGNGSCPSL